MQYDLNFILFEKKLPRSFMIKDKNDEKFLKKKENIFS